MKAPKKIYVCTECDAQSPKWLGRCPVCGAWNSLIEETFAAPAPSPAAPYAPARSGPASHAVPIDELDAADCDRTVTGIRELDRVLGGGLVDGSVVLLAGEPGIGKSTLLMQLCGMLGSAGKILYVSGEESRPQLKIRATRLGTTGKQNHIQNDHTSQHSYSTYCNNGLLSCFMHNGTAFFTDCFPLHMFPPAIIDLDDT